MSPSFNSEAVERKVLAELKPFQRATVDRIDALFRKDGGKAHRRVLVADEVGLGKTVVARGVIARTAKIRAEEGDNLFKVAYICANQNIARQNLEKLDIDGSVDALSRGMESEGLAESGIHKWAGSRLSMLPLLAELQETLLTRYGRFVQIIPVTPETSFRMGSRRGLDKERALICAMVGSLPKYSDKGIRMVLSHRLRGGVGARRWNDLVKTLQREVRKVDAGSRPFLSKFGSDFSRYGGMDATERLLAAKTDSDEADGVLALRRIFARIGAEKLDPDLVIMDEFQRFRYLIDDAQGDGGEVRILFDRFLRRNDENNPPRVLLLSATPFKLYSTREEMADAGEDEPYREFEGLIDFLFDKDCSSVREKWSRYVKKVSLSAQTELAPLIPLKQDAENALRAGMCRTERTLVESPVLRDESLGTRLHPDVAEIRSFVEYSDWARSIGASERLRVEYVKSVPYLLSFLTGYQEQDLLENAIKRNPRALGKATPSLKRDLWLSRPAVRRYAKIPPNNARLELLFGHAFAEEKDIKPELLLWIPPSFPCYPPTGPFAGGGGYSKTLVFSSWKMVPRMAATLLSYEAERRTIARVQRRRGEGLDYFGKKRFPAPRLQFRSKGVGASASTMTLFALLYPSRTLAELFSPIRAMNAGLPAERIASDVKAGIVRRLSTMPDPKEGRQDARWYYLAPMLFDRDKAALGWCKDVRKGVVFRKTNDRSALQRHFKRLESELKAGVEHLDLGRRPDDLVDVLVDMALGSPAVCMLRAGADSISATRVAEAFRSFFNAPETIAVVDCAYNRSDDAHWKNVLRYGRDGCLQSVLDEYVHLLSPSGGASGIDVADKIVAALSFRSAPYKIDTFDALGVRTRPSGGNGDSKKMSMRTHFAAAFAEGDGDGEKVANRVESLRDAFNSPFRPFVLASTSIGQEGLDFHWYCRKVFHWNLPHNPIDLEQREGRVDRYHGLAVRESIAAQFADKRDFQKDVWRELFDAAEQCGDPSGLLPHWRNSTEARYGVERIVPLYAFSLDESRYARLVQILALYRMALGQPRQEELLDRFLRSGVGQEEVRKLFLDLCPFSFDSSGRRACSDFLRSSGLS